MYKVSVVIPVYNVEPFIGECLQSIIHQSLKEIEIICVDDGSPDHSMDIVKKYASKDERIVIVRKKNGGLSSARNAGLKIAKGKYIYFIDGDDYITNNALQILYELSEKNNLDNIFFCASSFFENDEVLEKNKNYLNYYERSNEYPGIYTGQKLFVLWQKSDDFKPSACLQMARKKFLVDAHIEFYEGIIHEDNLFTIHNLMLARRVMCLSDQFYMRRVREGSIMTVRRNVANSFGYFVTISEFLKLADDVIMSGEFEDSVLHWLKAIYRHALNEIFEMTEKEIVPFFYDKSLSAKLEYLIFAHEAVLYKKREHKSLLNRIDQCNSDIRSLDMEKQNLHNQLREVKNSNAFKIGYILMFLQAKCKKLIVYIGNRIRNAYTVNE